MPASVQNPRLVLTLVWVIAALLAGSWIDYGWIPHDEGTLAQSAERVLHGELPHRDFDEGYTGGLSFLNAGAFRVFGITLWSLRIPLLVGLLACVPAMFYVASRFMPPPAAGATTLLAVAWSIPNYSAPMPSWYNLFLAVFGAAALLRHVETGWRSWLVIAGLCAGVSCVVKIVGLYLVAASLFFLAFREQELSRIDETEAVSTGDGPSSAYARVAQSAVLVFLALLVTLVVDQLGARELVHFVLPSVALALLFVWHERQSVRRPSAARWSTLVGLVVPFLAGLLVPVAVFLVPYVTSQSVPALINGVFIQSQTQLVFGHARPPSLLATTVATVPLVALVARSAWSTRIGRIEMVVTVVAAGCLLLAATSQAFVYRLVWYSVRALVPLVTIAGTLVLMWPASATRLSAVRRQQMLALLCVVAVVSVVQFPFSTPVYFLYVAALVALASAAVLCSVPMAPYTRWVLLGFYLLFAVGWNNGGVVYSLGFFFDRYDDTARMNLDRGQIRVSREEAVEYEVLVEVLRDRAQGDFIYATPDCPEVYFLSGLKNPTPTFFDFYDEPNGRTTRILSALEEHQVTAIALNTTPSFSGEVPPDLSTELVRQFPYSRVVGRFEVRWKE